MVCVTAGGACVTVTDGAVSVTVTAGAVSVTVSDGVAGASGVVVVGCVTVAAGAVAELVRAGSVGVVRVTPVSGTRSSPAAARGKPGRCNTGHERRPCEPDHLADGMALGGWR